MRKWVFLIALTLIVGLVAAQCAPVPTPEPAAPAEEAPASAEEATTPAEEEAPAPAEEEAVTLRLSMFGSADQEQMLDEWIPKFEEENPNIKVEYKVLDWATGTTELLASIAGGTGPDVVFAYSVWIPQWAAQGALSPLEDYFDEEDFIAPAVELAKWDDHLYALPWSLKVRAYYYRKDIFEEVGLDPEKYPETWDELVDYSQKLTKRDASGNIERVGFWVPTSHPYKTIQVWIPYMWSNGGRFFSEDGCKATFNSPEGVEALQLLDDLLNEYEVDEPGTIQVENVDFAQGRVASDISNIATRGMLADAPEVVPFVGMAGTPHKAGKESVSEMGGNYMGISATTEHLPEALSLLEFLALTPDLARRYAADDLGVPGATVAADEEYFATNPWAERWLEIMDETGKGLPQHPTWVEISDTVTKAIDQVYLEGRDPQEALDEAAEKVDAIIEANGCGAGW
jgi:multiple sugar transport system substrate-binding protein